MICVITGKGPLKAKYQSDLKNLQFSKVSFVLPWLEPDDYPKLLACADLGVSLHSSSSGLDLPMKVVDMFGCGLPVVALKFPALRELVQDGLTGFHFSNQEELADLIAQWFQMPNQEINENMVESIKAFQKLRWEQYWEEKAWPVISDMF